METTSCWEKGLIYCPDANSLATISLYAWLYIWREWLLDGEKVLSIYLGYTDLKAMSKLEHKLGVLMLKACCMEESLPHISMIWGEGSSLSVHEDTCLLHEFCSHIRNICGGVQRMNILESASWGREYNHLCRIGLGIFPCPTWKRWDGHSKSSWLNTGIDHVGESPGRQHRLRAQKHHQQTLFFCLQQLQMLCRSVKLTEADWRTSPYLCRPVQLLKLPEVHKICWWSVSWWKFQFPSGDHEPQCSECRSPYWCYAGEQEYDQSWWPLLPLWWDSPLLEITWPSCTLSEVLSGSWCLGGNGQNDRSGLEVYCIRYRIMEIVHTVLLYWRVGICSME